MIVTFTLSIFRSSNDLADLLLWVDVRCHASSGVRHALIYSQQILGESLTKLGV